MTVNNTKNHQKVSENFGDLQKRDIFEAFVEWYALPFSQRRKIGMATQNEFAEGHGVSKDTLSKWKKRPDFRSKVNRKIQHWGFEWTGLVMDGWLRACVQGNPRAIELWLAYFEDWTRKQVEPRKPQIEVTENDIRSLIHELPIERQREFYGLLANLHDAVAATRKERRNKVN